MLIDAHAHLDEYGEEELEHALAEIEGSNILTMSVSMDLSSFERTEEIARRSGFVIPGFGIHPWNAPAFADSIDQLDEPLSRSPFVGEIGLDHRWVSSDADYAAQRPVFEFQLDHAATRGKLANVHTAGAEHEAAVLIRSSGIERCIVHWYSGPDRALDQLIALGCTFTVGVEVLHSDFIRRLAARIPSELLLTETDSPGGSAWLTGATGMPGDVRRVIDELAEIRRVPPLDLIDLVRTNFFSLVADDPHLEAWASLDP